MFVIVDLANTRGVESPCSVYLVALNVCTQSIAIFTHWWQLYTEF